MTKIWLVSDTHFQHANILNFVGSDGGKIRPYFSSVDEMDEYMIMKWNDTIAVEDHVYHLGDVYFGNKDGADKILSRLNGKKRLILGNHDNGKDPVLLKHFQKIMESREFRDEKILLSHRPAHYSAFSHKGDGWINVHGHIHEKTLGEFGWVNVSVERTKYTPILLQDARNKHDSEFMDN